MVSKHKDPGEFSHHIYKRSQHEQTAVPRDSEELENKLRCMGQTLFWLNIVFFVLGLGICAGGIYLLSARIMILDMIDNRLLMVACWLLIVAAGVSIIISILGGLAAYLLSKGLLFIYAGAMTIIILMMLSGGIIAINTRTQFDDWAISKLSETLRGYYGVDQQYEYNRRVTYAWDKGQHYMSCCGVSGDHAWEMYRSTRWFIDRPGFENILYKNDPTVKHFVPQSCCVTDDNGRFVNLTKCQQFEDGPPALRTGQFNEGLKYTDCYSAITEWIYKYTAWLAGLGLGSAFVMISGLVISTWAGLIIPTHHRI